MLNALTTQIDGKGIHEYRSQTGLIICDEDHSSRSAKAIMDYEATSLDHLLTSRKDRNYTIDAETAWLWTPADLRMIPARSADRYFRKVESN